MDRIDEEMASPIEAPLYPTLSACERLTLIVHALVRRSLCSSPWLAQFAPSESLTFTHHYPPTILDRPRDGRRTGAPARASARSFLAFPVIVYTVRKKGITQKITS